MNTHRRVGLLAAIALFAATVFVVDLFTTTGIEVWVLYLPVVLSLVLVGDNRLILLGAATCSVFVLAAVFVSPPGANPSWWDQLNRSMGLMAIWLTATAGVAICTRSAELAAVLTDLRREVESHRGTAIALGESEARWRLAMEGGGVGTRDVDLRTGREVWSDTQFRILGYEPTRGGEATSEMWAGRTHPDDRARVLEEKARAREGHTLYHHEYRLRRLGQDSPVWVEVFGRFHYDEAGEAVRFVGVCFDISPRKDLERELLEITARRQQTFGQELHDGVGQELTGMGLMAKTLAQRLPEGGKEKQIASRLVTALSEAHQKIRELSRGLIPVDVDQRGLAAALADLATRTAEQAGITVTSECPDWVELPDHTTATHMFRIAQEAVTNALRHGRPSRITLSLLSDPNELRLRIKDDGAGIQDRPDNRDGLGRRIMKYRAGLIGGNLEIGAAEQGGTIVTLALPWSNRNGE